MEYKETLPRRGISRKAMMKRVARFKKLKGTDGGLPDSKMPGCERILYNVIGFQPPRVEKNGKQSPVGDIAARLAAIKSPKVSTWAIAARCPARARCCTTTIPTRLLSP